MMAIGIIISSRNQEFNGPWCSCATPKTKFSCKFHFFSLPLLNLVLGINYGHSYLGKEFHYHFHLGIGSNCSIKYICVVDGVLLSSFEFYVSK